MAAVCTLACFVCALLLVTVNSQTTQSLNGTQPSTSDGGDDDSVLDQSMEVFYDMVKGFLLTVQPNKIENQEWLNLSTIATGGFSFSELLSNWQGPVNYLVGFTICFVVGLLFCIIMPIVGCCFCCCRCCGRCGGKRKKEDPKRARCKRVSYCTVMLVLTTVMLAGVVCSFVSNDLIHRYLQNENNRGPVGRIESALSNIDKYINSTVDDVQEKALDAFDDTRTDLVRQINNTASGSVDRVANMMNASTFIQKAVDLSIEVNQTKDDLSAVETHLTALQKDGNSLSNNLTDIKEQIKSLCPGGCGVDESKYETNADFSALSNLSTEAGNVSKTLDMGQFISQANETVQEVKTNATKQIQDQINSATSTLDSIRGNISSQIGTFRKQISDATKFATDGTKTLNNSMTPEVKKYFDYVWYAGLGLCSVYLLIVVLYYLGILFGISGHRPGYDAPCCNKGKGANFLMAGVGFSFIFSWLLMLLVAILFILGGPMFTEVCRYFDQHNPKDLQFVSNLISQQFDLSKMLYNKSSVNLDLVTILEDCKENKPVYAVLKLENLVNLSSIIDLTSVDRQIDNLANHSFSLAEIHLVSPELEKKINDFGNSGLDNIPFNDFDAQMNKKLTNTNLTQLGNELEAAAAANITSAGDRQKVIQQAGRLKELDRTVVAQMKEDVKNLNKSLVSLKSHQNIKNRTNDLLAGLQDAETTFNANSSRLVNEMVVNLTQGLKKTTRENVNQLINDVTNNVGKCKPVYDSVYQLTDAACKTILDPFNGLWFSWGWCLFFFIPTIIFAVKLAGLYRREEEYTPEDKFGDANFSMYGGPPHDTIPLTSVDTRHGGSGSGYPGMANSGYRSHDDGYQGGRHSHTNGYQPYDMRSQGSKEFPPPEYGGGGPPSYPPHYDHSRSQSRVSDYPRHY